VRWRSALPVPLLAAALSCGYVGPVVPPSARIPIAIADLTVAERGDQLLIQFTAPSRTTDNLDIKRFESIELNITPDSGPARNYQLPLSPEQTDPTAPITPIHDSIPAADWAGKHIEVRVRSAMRSDDRYSAWSNVVKLDVVEPLAPPKLSVQPTAAGYELKWTPAPAGVSHRILRRGPGMNAPAELTTTEGESFIDRTAQWSTPYSYTAVAMKDGAESLPSAPVTVNAPDTFPPSTPEEVTAVASPRGVEVSWQRSPEPDVKGYYVYRAQAGGTFARQGDLTTLPVFTDTTAEHDKSYRYEVSAVDTSGNESPRSASADVDVP